MNRRKFLSGAAAASLAGSACRRPSSSTSYRTLSGVEARALEVLCDQIVPADADPGALWAGAVRFIDIQLTRRYKAHRERYRAGLQEAVNNARSRFGKALDELDAAGRLECAEALEKSNPDFFNLLVSHTMQAYYGSPRHGGNREYASWRMLGVSPLPVRGRQQQDAAKVSS